MTTGKDRFYTDLSALLSSKVDAASVSGYSVRDLLFFLDNAVVRERLDLPTAVRVHCPLGHYLFDGDLLELDSGRVSFIPERDAVDHPVNNVYRWTNGNPEARTAVEQAAGTMRVHVTCPVNSCDYDGQFYFSTVTAHVAVQVMAGKTDVTLAL